MTTLAIEIQKLHEAMRDKSSVVHTEKWQGVDISKKNEMATHELRHINFRAPIGTEDLSYFQFQVRPNLPWADNHFLERVCGEPINPGLEWANWPYGHSADKFRDAQGMFNHNYMERYWPQYARLPNEPTFKSGDCVMNRLNYEGYALFPRAGIKYRYGDLGDVVNLLSSQPLTRQAILPVWFPEDTGVVHGDRAPCSIAYQFFVRDDKIDIVYWLRSCDFLRHFRDDVYLTIRLLLWVLHQCRERNSYFDKVKLGEFVMFITSLHIFRNDYPQLFGRQP